MLQIDHLSLNVRATAADERAERLARRLRAAAVAGIERNRIAAAAPGSPAYLFVDRLAFACSVSSEWDDAAIGAAVARGLAAALARSAELEQTLAFRDRTELLAAFYSALAEGRAWEQWWLEEFDGLKALPASAALRTSVMNEREHGIAALARLTETLLWRVVGLLSPGDAGRLLEWFAARPRTAAASPASLWKLSSSIAKGGNEARDLLRALIAVERAVPGAAGAKTVQWLREMASLRTAAARGDLQLPAPGDAPTTFALRAAAAKLSLTGDWLEELDESEAQRIAEELASPGAPAPSPRNENDLRKTAAAHERLFTPHGGAFVLLKALDWVGWTASWARSIPGREELARALAWALVVRALLPGAARDALRDSALHAAFGLERPLELLRSRRVEVRAMLQGASITKTAEVLLEEFSRRIPGLAGASAPYVRTNALSLPASTERHGNDCIVRLGRAPLDVLLVLAGAKTGRIALPGGPTIELRVESA